MVRGQKFGLDIDYSVVQRNLQVTISRVQRGTKRATIAACEDIKEMSLAQVPRDTETLANSFFYKVEGYRRGFTAVLGYGGNGDPINPKTGQPASKYMVAVHEDLSAQHPVGKAKFLEDPVREYGERFGPRAVGILRSELGM